MVLQYNVKDTDTQYQAEYWLYCWIRQDKMQMSVWRKIKQRLR